mmetsp:Transcript_51702/g.165489  ORF Transcript_51702/g.165489 Transcript_51702/m.165489 type:complete len:1265 (+) Transcript_51702:156-3950(+)
MQFGRTASQKSAREQNPVDDAYCLAWTLTQSAELTAGADVLRSLHDEIRSCAELVGATTLEVSATHGLLRCDISSRHHADKVTAADTAVRLGQLICRWSAEQEPALDLRVGVHRGELGWIEVPGMKQVGYFGVAASTSRRLAESCPKSRCVHLLPGVKERLVVLERIPFSVWWNSSCTPATEAYYLEPWAEAICDEPLTLAANAGQSKRAALARGSSKVRSSTFDMTNADFAAWLESFGVDTSKFGKGQAKTLSEFQKEIKDQHKSYLIETAGKLERRMELVRVNLHAKDNSGQDRVLTMALEVMHDGRTRTRNQKLAWVVPEGVSWINTIDTGFQDTFNLPPTVRQEMLPVEANWYKEERLYSPSIPGLLTTYVIYEAIVRVRDPLHKELTCLGLPSMQTFTTSDQQNSEKRTQWTWGRVGEQTSAADVMAHLLQEHKISIHEFDPGAFDELVEEVYETKNSTLMVKNGELLRYLQIVKVWLSTDIMSVPHVLLTLAKVQRGRRDDTIAHRPISMRMHSGQTWEEALTNVLTERLGLDLQFQRENIIVDHSTHRLCEEIELSRSYPGLKTVYRIHEVTCRILATHPLLGLPEGTDFAFSRTKRGKSGANEDVVTMYFTWSGQKDMVRKSSCRKDIVDYELPQKQEGALDPKRRLPAPTPMTVPADIKADYVIHALMKGKKTNWDRARKAARRIRDADYSCKAFCEDCIAAFPELALYVAGESMEAATTSGRSADDEFQRTMGALFAVYWLMRLDTDGSQAFSFGIDDNWRPLSSVSAKPRRDPAELKKRAAFLQQVKWPLFEDVFVAAGILKCPTADKQRTKGKPAHDEERTLAMLVLTAIHDIMKIQALLPQVEARHSPFCGYKAGEVIGDHDIALGYVLEHVPQALPSFAGLPKAQQESVKFTQCNMEYNMGWLVQAEAPPGALFRKFKAMILSGRANPSDIAFYFTHWLTDLAGAEPCPQEGCEKYVLKFPQKVLTAFLNSFPFVQHLAAKSETQVYEDYLVWRWTSHEPSLGPAPTGEGSIARLRAVVMAQGHSSQVLQAFDALSEADRKVLHAEFACTGCCEQEYARDLSGTKGGPAFLIYYAPALLQKNCALDAIGALEILAEVLRKARELWPFQQQSAGETVTLRIDALKELEVHMLRLARPGEFWALQRTSSVDAMVKKTSLVGMDGSQQEFDASTQRILNFGTEPMRAANSGRPLLKDVDAWQEPRVATESTDDVPELQPGQMQAQPLCLGDGDADFMCGSTWCFWSQKAVAAS